MRYKIWLDTIIDVEANILNRLYKVPLPYSNLSIFILVSIPILLIYLAGFIFSVLGKFTSLYIYSHPILFFILGSISTSFAIVKFTSTYPDIFNDAFSTLYDPLKNTMSYQKAVRYMSCTMFDNRSITKYSIIASVILSFIGSISWYFYADFPICYQQSNVFFIRDVAWYSKDNIILKILTINLLGYVVMFLLVTLGTLMVKNLVLLTNMTKYSYLALPIVVSKNFEKLINFNFQIAALWFWGVFLFVIMETANITIVYVIFILILLLIGVMFLSVPYISLKKILDQMQCDKINAAALKVKKDKTNLLSSDIASDLEYSLSASLLQKNTILLQIVKIGPAIFSTIMKLYQG